MDKEKEYLQERKLLIFYISDIEPDYFPNQQLTFLPEQWTLFLETHTCYERSELLYPSVTMAGFSTVKDACGQIFIDIEDSLFERVLFEDLSPEEKEEFVSEVPDYDEDESPEVQMLRDSYLLVVFLGSDEMGKFVGNHIKNSGVLDYLDEFKICSVNVNTMGYMLTELLIPRGLKGSGAQTAFQCDGKHSN